MDMCCKVILLIQSVQFSFIYLFIFTYFPRMSSLYQYIDNRFSVLDSDVAQVNNHLKDLSVDQTDSKIVNENESRAKFGIVRMLSRKSKASMQHTAIMKNSLETPSMPRYSVSSSVDMSSADADSIFESLGTMLNDLVFAVHELSCHFPADVNFTDLIVGRFRVHIADTFSRLTDLLLALPKNTLIGLKWIQQYRQFLVDLSES